MPLKREVWQIEADAVAPQVYLYDGPDEGGGGGGGAPVRDLKKKR